MQLTAEQTRFRDWLEENAPYLLGMWDWEQRSVLPARVDNYLGLASHGEAAMCRFAVGVWLGRNDYAFDFIEAAGALDAQQRAAVAEWFNTPLWP